MIRKADYVYKKNRVLKASTQHFKDTKKNKIFVSVEISGSQEIHVEKKKKKKKTDLLGFE